MDEFDLQPEKPARGAMLWNILTGVLLFGILCLVGYFFLVFSNPQSRLNPFRPIPLSTQFVLPTGTITPVQLPATWTASPSLVPTTTNTLVPTWTPLPTNTSFVVPSPTSRYTPTRTRTPTRTVKPTGMPYGVTIAYLDSTIYHPEAACNWLGVAGQATDKSNTPILYLVVHLYGYLDGKQIDLRTLTGTAPSYGQAGFEFVLSDQIIASNDALWIELTDQTGALLTDKIYFDTFADCSKNLVLFRFTKNR